MAIEKRVDLLMSARRFSSCPCNDVTQNMLEDGLQCEKKKIEVVREVYAKRQKRHGISLTQPFVTEPTSNKTKPIAGSGVQMETEDKF